MSLRVSVLVPPAAAGSRSLLSSLDQQDLPAAEFEVLIGDDEHDPDLTTRLDDLVAHRTNVTRVPVPAGTDVATTLLDRARGEYVVAVPSERVLTPDALALLSAHADATGAEVCLGLTGRAGSRPARLPAWPEQLAGPAGGLRRRSSAAAEQVAADLTGGDATADGAAAVTATLCFVDGPAPDRRTPPEPERSVRARAARARWSGGVLDLVLKLSEPAEDVQVSLYSDRFGVEWPLPDARVDGDRVRLRIDPAAVPGPGALPDGIWWPSVRIDGRPPILVRARPRKAHGASVRERTVVSFSRAKRLGIDVGAHNHQAVRQLAPGTTTVVEDSRGSLLTSTLRNIDLAPGTRHTGELRLGTMPVVAWLEQEDGAKPVLRAWVSGLAGESTLYTRFGPISFAPTGARLVIDGVGTMTVVPTSRRPAAGLPDALVVPATAGKARRLAGRALRSVRG